jgi:hypothetical protein
MYTTTFVSFVPPKTSLIELLTACGVSFQDNDFLESDLVKKLSNIKHAVEPDSNGSFQQMAFAKLFPFNARWNSGQYIAIEVRFSV